MTMNRRFLRLAVSMAISFAALTAAPAPSDPTPPDALRGLWKAKRWLEPRAPGTLIIQRDGKAYTADIAGRILPVTAHGSELSFRFPDGRRSFRGKLAAGDIRGFWYEPSAFPVQLRAAGPNRWIGAVETYERTLTLYVLVRKRPDGTLAALLDNPERDWAARLGVESLVRDGSAVKLMGKQAVVTGTYDAENDRISLPFPGNGGTSAFSP